ncbi:MAG: DUF2306 domain-containing protein [Gammaproteobacteria bacterium]|nr:DUF2306 domain-containing protein [Gammaproteobacteria bacterium]
MYEHLLNHPLGLIHVLSAITAMLAGTAVMLVRKGTNRHLWVGRSYVVMMLATNASAMMIYELFGRFGPFHWMVLASSASWLAGYVVVWRRKKGWRYQHAYFMAGSYVGLMAAAAAEVATRVPGWSFWLTVVVSSMTVIFVGLYVMQRTIPKILSVSARGQ